MTRDAHGGSLRAAPSKLAPRGSSAGTRAQSRRPPLQPRKADAAAVDAADLRGSDDGELSDMTNLSVSWTDEAVESLAGLLDKLESHSAHNSPTRPASRHDEVSGGAPEQIDSKGHPLNGSLARNRKEKLLLKCLSK